ncbi:hypothetical protein QBC45DRAFT_332564 [Copromyces sp. CBS 386.78]|nr:hypothetical protein QBC45DRAFT_332564 [Copromyces sp. CBS 386.78]
MEGRFQRAVDFYYENLGVSVTTLCKIYDVPCKRLRNYIKGIPPKKSIPSKRTKFTAANEKALCNYIDRLDRINFVVRPLYIKDAANLLF